MRRGRGRRIEDLESTKLGEEKKQKERSKSIYSSSFLTHYPFINER